MLTAGELLVDIPHVASGDDSAVHALKTLMQSKHGVIAVEEQGCGKKLLTLLSALQAVVDIESLATLKARDLVLRLNLPLLQPDHPWPEFFKELCRWGALPVAGPQGELLGAVSAVSLTGALGFRLEELSRELDAIINCSSDEILIADGAGTVLRANAVFEENYGLKVADILGKKVGDLEKQKVFNPSVTRLVLRKRSAQSVIQTCSDGRKFLATGTPAFDSNGGIFRVIVNTRDITRLNKLKQKLEETELLKERYAQELLELRQSAGPSGEVFTASPPMLQLMKTARKIAPVDSTVLITGESGVGKGVLARYIHNNSPRSSKPFITVNCGAIPENLLESELFGYAPGAFTGASKEGKVGKMELAHEGTFFLDEVTELPLNLQVKLLHVIQEGVISRIGGIREIRLDLRFIAASNRGVENLVEEGKFREDLFFRLNVIPLEIPPLRERPEDIENLACHFLKKYNRKYRKEREFDPGIFSYLKNYRWPGNVRELENLIERMAIVVDEDCIGIANLPGYIVGGKDAALPSLPLQPLKQAKEAVERDLLTQALRCCRTTYEMAELLEIDQSTVVRKLQKYHLPLPDAEMHQP